MMGVDQKTSFNSISSSREPSRYSAAMEGSQFVRRAAEREIGFYKRSVMTSANSPFAESSQ
jgi:hypothetical protein